jgi:predicted alpha/beta-fold hydrolase
MEDFRAPGWLPGGHAQTIWPALFSRRYLGPRPALRRERWATPDGDFVDVDWQGEDADATLLVLFHGLEGSSSSHYAQAFAAEARQRGWRFAIPHFRGCSGELNLAPRAYHSGDWEEVAWMLARFRSLHRGSIVAVGVSLGGNALLRFAEEAGGAASAIVRAVAAVSAPLDLAAGGRSIGSGFGRQVYTRMFMRTMRPKALRKLAQHPGLFDAGRMRVARGLRDFDDIFTAPLHGFRDAADYYARASAGPQLGRIRIPALVLNARNDPFMPAAALPRANSVGPCVTLWQPAHGGHVGFPSGRWPGHLQALPERVAGWLSRRL